MKTTLLLVFFLGISCVGQKAAYQENKPYIYNNSLRPKLVLEGLYSNIELPEFKVIKNKKTLHYFLLQINKTRKPGIPIPEVDFSKEIVLLYCGGTTEGIIPLELIVLKETSNRIVIGLNKSETLKKEKHHVLTTPFCMYKLPLTSKEIIFQSK